jgi:hypothetical protein
VASGVGLFRSESQTGVLISKVREERRLTMLPWLRRWRDWTIKGSSNRLRQCRTSIRSKNWSASLAKLKSTMPMTKLGSMI